MTGRHNGYGRSSFGRRGHFSGHEPSCYLQDNYRLDITAIVTRDILKCKA